KTSRKSWEPSAERRKVSLNFSERILQTPYSIRRTRLSLRTTKNRVEKSRKLSARVSGPAKSPRSIQRRPSRSTASQNISRPPNHFLQPVEEAGHLLEVFPKKKMLADDPSLGHNYCDP